MEHDRRGTEPPEEEPPEDRPSSGKASGDEDHGPLGNPAVDEEALSHRQANRDPEDDGGDEKGRS
jgi:hypothetical protein